MKAVTIIILEALLLLAAILGAHFLESRVDFIPSFLIQLPKVDYTPEDFRIVLTYFAVVYLAILLAAAAIFGAWQPTDTRRTVKEVFGLALGFAIAAMGLFLTTEIAFDPNFIVGIAVLSVVLFIAVHLTLATRRQGTPLSHLGNLASAILRTAIHPVGALIILLALSPGVLAHLFVSDRDFANTVTRIRIFFSGQEEGSYALTDVFQGERFAQPMMVRPHPGDPGILYVLGRAGTLEKLDYPSGENRQMVLDIRDKVGEVESENGLLGFDFHPGFARRGSASEGIIYAYYTSVHDGEQVNHLSKFSLKGGSPEANSRSEAPLMTLPREPSGFHNGGTVTFGADGYLYLAVGEGVHPKSARSTAETLRGGVLRIDIQCSGTSRPITRQPAEGQVEGYCIPSDNPFVDTPEVMDEYWALGLRNPYRMHFDAATGTLWAGDVGSTKWEEINIVEAGHHYQYPFVEGYEDTTISRPETVMGQESPPVYTYVHTAYDRAVVGGNVYRGSRFPELQNRYLFADNYSSKVFAMPATGERVDTVEHIATADQFAQRGTSSLSILDDGEVVLTTLGKSTSPTGRVLKLTTGTQSDAAPPAQSEQHSPVTTEEVRSIYIANCARCHGSNGQGDGPDAGMLPTAVPNFQTTATPEKDDDWYAKVIREGGYAVGLNAAMPPWGHILTDEEVEGLVALIRQFQESESGQ